MKKISLLLSISALFFALVAFTPPAEKLVSSKSHVKFYSHTNVEDIEANNYATVSTLNTVTGDLVFSVPMQGFEFEKSLMQKHFNSDKFLDTSTFPKAKLKGKITNLDQIDFGQDGTYDADVEGELTIRGATKSLKEKGKVIVKGGIVKVHTVFNVTLSDYGVTFIKGKPSSNIAKIVEVTVHVEYESK